MPQNQLTNHFTLDELTRSATALRHGLANVPDAPEVANLTLLAMHILEPVRQHFGIAFRPSSAFRTGPVNRLVGSRSTSQHVLGQAADFEVPPLANRLLADWIKANLTFDQLILEYHRPDDPASGWVHCSYQQDQNRNQCLIFDGTEYRKF